MKYIEPELEVIELNHLGVITQSVLNTDDKGEGGSIDDEYFG